MNDLITVFRMSEISASARIRVITQLGKTINDERASNISEPIVYELVLLLDPNDPIKDDAWFKQLAGV